MAWEYTPAWLASPRCGILGQLRDFAIRPDGQDIYSTESSIWPDASPLEAFVKALGHLASIGFS